MYPALISPLMNSEGLIVAESMSTEVQTALALSVTNLASIEILQALALQNVDGTYTGSASTNLSVDGTVTCAEVLSNAIIATGQIGNTIQNYDGSFTVDYQGNTTVNQLNYNILNPALPPSSWVGTATSDLDMATHNIANASSIYTGTLNATKLDNSGYIICDSLYSANNIVRLDSAGIKCMNSEGNATSDFNNFNTYSDNGGTLTGVFNAAGNAIMQNFYLFGVQPNDFSINHDKSILTTGDITTATSHTTGTATLHDLALTTTLTDSTASTGTSGQLLSSTGLATQWVDAPISGWVGTATSDLNMGSYNIIGTANKGTSLNIGSNIALNSHSISGVSSISASGTVTANICSSTYINNLVSIDGLSNPILVLKNLDLSSNTLNAGESTLASIILSGSLTDGSSSVGSNGQILSSTGTAIKWIDEADVVTVKPTYDYWVCPNGSNSSSGSQTAPFATIQNAINVCQALTDGIPRVIHVMAGSYVENLVLNKSRVSLVGEGSSNNPDIGTSIYGTILINITSGNSDLNNNNIYFSNFLINSLVTDSTNNFVHRLFFSNCYLYANAGCLLMSCVGDYRLNLNNCTISNSSTTATDSILDIQGSGMISITNCQVTSKGDVQNCLKLSNSVRVQLLANCVFESDSGSTSATAIMLSSTSSSFSLGNCAFVYSSSAIKSNANSACAVKISGTGSLVILNNVVSLTGLSSSNFAWMNSGSGVYIFGNNVSTSSPAGSSANTIQGSLNVSKFACTSCQ